MSRHLVVDLSSHGYGHAAITCPVLNALRPQARNIKVTIRTAVPAALIAERADFDFDYVAKPDFGMVMAGTMSVLSDESYMAYKELHKDWEANVAAATAELGTLKPSLLLSNISYLSIAATRKAGIPAVAFGAVNWADIFRHYCGDYPQSRSILEQMTDAYAGAEIFLQPIPAMSMPSIHRHRLVGPVAEIGRDRRAELSERLNLDPDRRLVLLALGGIPTRLSFDAWPRLGETCVITDSQLQANHPDVVSCDGLSFPFVDLVRSCDAAITRPGYGTIAEAACNGKPILLVPRESWPETPAFVEWLATNGRAVILEEKESRSGDILAKIEAVCAMLLPPVPAPSGVAEVAAELAKRLQ
jgi:hypothetical protein